MRYRDPRIEDDTSAPRSMHGRAFASRLARQLERFLRDSPRTFRHDRAVLDLAGELEAARDVAKELADDALATRLRRAGRDAVPLMMQVLRRTPNRVVIAETVRRHRLDRIEVECLLVLALAAIGRSSIDDMNEIRADLAIRAGDAIRVTRALAPEGKLARHELVCIDDSVPFGSPTVKLHPDLLARLVGGRRCSAAVRHVASQAELLEGLPPLMGAFFDLASQFHDGDPSISPRHARSVARRRQLLNELVATLQSHPAWPLSRLERTTPDADFAMLVMLIGQELGLKAVNFDAFTGRSMAAAASERPDDVPRLLRRLSPRGHLRRERLVRVCGGLGNVNRQDESGTLATCSFELTERAVLMLGLKPSMRRRAGARAPQVRMNQLVLPERVRSAVRMAIAQEHHGEVLFRRWGLGDAIRTGRGTTLLFSGPPGVGKTATAEAIAHELGRPIIVASVADLESCWVGETEKAIVRAFGEAADSDAVLFWDEADSFFADREHASHQWEARHVNVLLQELERFDGVCILATNRRSALDPALERRISMKIEFERPDRDGVRAIWRKLLPARLPLAPDVDVEDLAESELSGGQIKNVVLNAARRALLRGPRTRVTREDFEAAMRLEVEGSWTMREQVGFAVSRGTNQRGVRDERGCRS